MSKTLRAQFTIDPDTEEFTRLRSVCEPGNPWRCLIATMESLELGKRMSVRLDHDKKAGTIGVTHGDLRYERPMTPEEVRFASRFDLGQQIRKPLTVRVDLADNVWTAEAGQFVLWYRLQHAAGEHTDGFYPLPQTGTPQQIGSAITYARRYALTAITGIAPADDDDAAAHG